jgi:hypothetical protein
VARGNILQTSAVSWIKPCVCKLCFSNELFSSLFFLFQIIFTALIAFYKTLFVFIIHYLGLPW